MPEEQLGTVIATEENPNTYQFVFVVSGNVVKGQYVEVHHEKRIYIALVNELMRSNKYFERPETVMDYERVGNIDMSFPTDDWDYMVAEARLFGVFEDDMLKRAVVPPAPGSKVMRADESRLKKFIGIADEGIHIGSLPNHSFPLTVDISRLFQKHLAILAMSGAGKSYLAGVLIEELLSRKKEDGRLAVVILDVHGEYTGYKQAFPKQVDVVAADSIRIALKNLSAGMVSEWLEGITAPQKRELQKSMADTRKFCSSQGKPYGLSELESNIAAQLDDKKKEHKNLLGWMSELKRYRLISYSEKPKLKDSVAPGKMLIIDFTSIDNNQKKQIIASYLCQRLFNLRKKGKISPFVLFIEEAHNFAKEKAMKHNAIAKGIIETIAREGRKFGASIVLITQRPVRLSTTALSQCNTNIILRITNPFDQKHIGESAEGIDNYVLNSLSTLHVGEALVVGEAVNIPVMVKVRKRKQTIRKSEVNLKDLALKFEKQKELNSQDVEAFI